MSRPLVSVAMGTRNGERWLRPQLDSIYAQTWSPLEVVVTDDASTDGTITILAEYARSQGLRYEINPSPLGLVKNFERAISLCRGEFIALSDQDDLWKLHKIETLVANLGDATLIYCNNQEYLDVDGETRVDTSFEHVVRFARAHGSGRPTRYLLAENWVVCHSLLFRRELVRHALPIPPHQLFHDGWLALVASKLGGIRYHDEPLQTYRRHRGSLTWVDPDRRGHETGFRERWRRKCAHETARLGDALGLPLLDEDDCRFVADLLSYYRSGLRRGSRWRSFRSGLRVAPCFATLYGDQRRWRFPLRALLGGL